MRLPGRLASQAAIIFGARLVGAGLVFLTQAAIARLWGADRLGEYLVVIAAANLVAVVMPLGFQVIGTYFAAEYRARSQGALLRAFLRRAYAHVAIASIVLIAAGPYMVGLLGEAGRVIEAVWWPTMLLTIGTALVFVNGALLVGLRRPLAGFLADLLLRPLAMVAGFALALTFATPQSGFALLMWVAGGGYFAIALGHFGWVAATARSVPVEESPSAGEARRWWRFALPWVVITLATDFFFDIDILLLAQLLDRGDLAVFGVCARVFAILSFGVGTVYAVMLPDIVEAEALRDRQAFHRKVGDANLIAASVAGIVSILTLLAGHFLLGLFGPRFLAGAAPLFVLCIGLLIRALLGPASLILSVRDRPYASLPAVALGIGTLFAANLWLVPTHGPIGAAAAAVLAIAVWSAALWGIAYRLTGIDVSVWPRLRSLIFPAETPTAPGASGGAPSGA